MIVKNVLKLANFSTSAGVVDEAILTKPGIRPGFLIGLITFDKKKNQALY
jgi:hypothetical protein